MSEKAKRINTLPIVMGGVVVAGVFGVGYAFRKELGFGRKPPPPPPPKVVETNEVAEVDIPVVDVDVGGITTAQGIFYVPVATQSEAMKREAEAKKAAEEAEKK